jgi:glucose dehydrogenase
MATTKVSYFTKVRGLASVVWDGKKNKALVEFDKQGLAYTTNQTVAKKLKELGYREVSAEMIEQAKLIPPDKFESMQGRQPGRGYVNEPDMQGPAVDPKDALFEPEIDEQFVE